MRTRPAGTMALRLAWLRESLPVMAVLGRALRTLAWLVLLGHAALILLVFAASLLLLRVNPPATALMAWRTITTHQQIRPVRFVPLRQVPVPLRTMVVRLEDMHFYQHAGVDLGALRDAWNINASIGWTAVGGSTIPMQLARNLFLTPRKTYFRKYLEALIAVEMDAVLPKSRILELYLNCIEWGKGVFGIGAAAEASYGTTPAALGLDQMRRLAAIITNPVRFTVDTLFQSRQMAERYAYLLSRFPDPAAAVVPEAAPVPAADEAAGKIAPVPDAAAPAAPAGTAPPSSTPSP